MSPCSALLSLITQKSYSNCIKTSILNFCLKARGKKWSRDRILFIPSARTRMEFTQTSRYECHSFTQCLEMAFHLVLSSRVIILSSIYMHDFFFFLWRVWITFLELITTRIWWNSSIRIWKACFILLNYHQLYWMNDISVLEFKKRREWKVSKHPICPIKRVDLTSTKAKTWM